MKRIISATTAIIAVSLTAASPAAAQVNELDPQQVESAVRYALPFAFDGYLARCSASLDADGYSISNANRLRAKFSDGSDASWPGAKSLMIQMASQEAEGMSAVFDMMEDDDLKPFVEGLVQGMAAQELNVEDCGTVERALEILDPLPADNVAAMLGFLVELGLNNDDKSTDPVGDKSQ